MCMMSMSTLTFAAMLDDPLIQAVMRSDKVAEHDYAAMLHRVKDRLETRAPFVARTPELMEA